MNTVSLAALDNSNNAIVSNAESLIESNSLLGLDSQLQQSNNLVVIDAGIEDYTHLAEELLDKATVLMLDSQTDGIFQIDTAISQFQSLEALHIVSHGSSGQLQLGSSQLNTDSLATYGETIASWSDIFTDTADILIYGCNVAAGDVGQNFVDYLSLLTDADIAASDDLTGHDSLRGNWTLEVSTGIIENTLFSSEVTQNYSGILHAGHFHNDYVVQTDAAFQDQVLFSDLGEPTSISALPDGRMLILRKPGQIQVFDTTDTQPTLSSYLDLSNIVQGGFEPGLMDIALDPDFESNGHFYLYYSRKNGGAGRFRISRFTDNGGTADLSSEFVVWEKPEEISNGFHHGGGLDIGPDGKLYLTTGEEFNAAGAQDLTFSGGKVIRINTDGTIPIDNPFYDGAGPNLDEIWAYGLRNPFRAFWDIPSNRFFIGEVGGNDQLVALEDLHLGSAGANFGWPQFEGSSGDPSISDPIFSYDHLEGTPFGGAIAGGFVYRGDQLPSDFNGAYFYGDYAQGWVRYLKFDAAGDVIDADPNTPDVEAFNFSNDADSIVDLEQGIDGSIYYVSYGQFAGNTGVLHRVSYDSGNTLPTIDQAVADVTEGAAGLTVNFSGGASDLEGDPLSYLWTFGDGQTANTANATYTYNNNGVYTAFLQVSDGTGTTTSETIAIQVGDRPDATILTPNNGGLFRAGETITFNAIATDANETLTDANFAWTGEFIHNAHTHPGFGVVNDDTFNFTIPTTGHGFADNTGYRITLTVTDSDGLFDTETISIFPEKVDLTFNSNVPGGITYNFDGLFREGAFIADTAIDYQHLISAPEQVVRNGVTYAFDSWSNGVTTAALALTAPETDQTYTANYVVVPTNPAALPVTNGLVLHLETDQGISANGNVVTGWADQSGSGNDLTGVGDPRLVANGLNGQAVIAFDGAGDKLERSLGLTDLPTGSADRTLFIVAKYNSNGYGGFAYGRPDLNNTFGLAVDNNGDLLVQAWGNNNDNRTKVDGNGAGWLTQSATLENNFLTHYKDGQQIDSGNHIYNTTLDQLVLGAEIDSSPYLDMEVAAVLVYDTALSEAERQQVENYLQNKYFNAENNNASPTAADDSFSVAANTSGNTFNVLSNDSDADGDPLTLTSVSAASNGGAVSVSANQVNYTPANGFTGTETFTYTVSDGQGGSDMATVSVDVAANNNNTAPIATDDSYTVVEDSTSNLLNVLTNDSDADIANGTGSIDFANYTTTMSQNRVLQVTQTVANGGLDGSAIVFDATPTGGSAPHFMNMAGAPEYLRQHNAGGNGDRIRFSMARQDGLAFSFNSFRYSAETAALNDGFTVIGTTATGAQISQSFGPAATPTVFETAQLTDAAWQNVTSVEFVGDRTATGMMNQYLFIDDVVVSAPALSITGVSATNQGGSVSINAAQDSLVYTPSANFAGTESFTYTISDGNGGTSQATVTVTVPNTNDTPTAISDNVAVDADSMNNVLNVRANDLDPDTGDTLTITGVSTASNGGTVGTDATGTNLLYTPIAGFSGTETFTYTVEDSFGVSSTATVAVTVAAASALPVSTGLVLHLDADNGVTTDGSDLVTGWTDQSSAGNDLTGTGDPRLVANGLNGQSVIVFDGAGDKLERTVGLAGLPTGGSDRTLFMVAKYNSNGYGGFAYGSAANNQTFGLVVANDGDLMVQAWGRGNDNATNIDGTGAGWLTQSVTLNGGLLTHYKDGAAIDSASHNYNTTLERLVLGAEIDSSPYLDMEVATILVYDRALSEAERQQVEEYLQQRYFSTTTPNNQAPVATDDTATVPEEGSTLVNVLSNDTDVDSDPVELTDFTQAANGTVMRSDSGTPADTSDDQLVYAPNLNFAGNDVFTYTVSDGRGGTDTASVNVTVNNVNDDPTATNDVFNVNVDSVDNTLAVLTNDIDPDAGDSLTITTVGTPSDNGTVGTDATGTNLLYTPIAGFSGTETFTYTVEDSFGVSSTATVAVTVAAASALPVSAGLVLHLDADNGVTTDGSDLVTGWTDQSSAGNDLTGTGDPRLVANGLNGQSVIVFDGAGDKLERTVGLAGLPTGGSDRTLFMVAKYNSNGYGGFAYGSAANNQTFGLVVANDGDLMVQAWGRGNDNATNIDGTGAGWLTQSVTLNGGLLTHYKDGAAIDSASHNYNTTLERLVLGAEIDSSPYLDMEVATILVYDRALSEAERQQVEEYLQQRYFGA